MATVSLWTAAPRYDANEDEKNLTFDEISTALTDLYGPPSSATAGGGVDRRNHGPRHVQQDEIDMLELILTNVPVSDKEHYLRARRTCPDLAMRRLELFLITKESESMAEVANKMCHYWKERVELFGEEKAFLPMTLGGAMRDDVETLKKQGLYYLPRIEDGFGRGIMYNSRPGLDSSTRNRNSILRSRWYITEVALEEMADASKGVIIVINGNVPLEKLDRKLMSARNRQWDFLPLKLRAFHVVKKKKNWYHELVLPALQKCWGSTVTRRYKEHKGDKATILESLSKHGITPEMVPVEIGGTYSFDYHRWLEDQIDRGL